MHPNRLFRSENQALFEALIDDIAFGMVFLATPDGPRVAHVPLVSDGKGKLRFHLARGNALTRHLEGARALVTVNGPDGYVSPRWYDSRDSVPTWDYVALEMEGNVRKLDDNALEELLHTIIEKFEDRMGGEPWRASETSESLWAGLFRGIVGFELEVAEWRPTFKLSQKRTPAERERIAKGLAASGNSPLAASMLGFVS